ncbi:MAG TPA: methyltransferase domain-containing protein [Alphaproteobacteria bacterium]|nr:methyltransferase domain-containing protein [Alphaproteobacteria bacterium]
MIFDPRAVAAHRARAESLAGEAGFLFREVAARLAERVGEVNRTFGRTLDLGCRGGLVAKALDEAGAVRNRGIVTLIEMAGTRDAQLEGPTFVAGTEEALPFADASLDLVASNLTLHWVNDLPGTMVQVRRALKPDGLFLAAMLGGETLTELRQALDQAEQECEGGISPRVSPFVDVRDAGSLLQRAGFALPVADADTIIVTYADMFTLMQDLRAMGESNAVAERRKTFLRRETLYRAAEIYGRDFAEDGGCIRATFQVIWLTGWVPHESQQKPLRPGSATARLADALGTEEHSIGEKAPGPRKGKPN